MIKKFLNIEKELSQILELLSLLPNHLEISYLRGAFETLKKFDSLTIMLQRDGMPFVESREIFDLFLANFPDLAHYISSDALIIENEKFEKTVMKIARNMPLSDQEAAIVAPLLKEEYSVVEAQLHASGDEQLSSVMSESEVAYSELLQRKLKRQRMQVLEQEKPKSYIDLSMLPGTSVNCERLFSTAKFILSDTRKRTSPKLFEALLLLKVNRSFWNTSSVARAMGRTVNKGGNAVADDDNLDVLSDCIA